MPINPYQSVQPVNRSDGENDKLVFDGVIEQTDHQRLLRRTWQAWLCLVLVALLGTWTTFFASIGLMVLFDVGNVPRGIVLLAFCAVMYVACWFILRLADPKHRAKRILKKHPELLSLARGELDSSGLWFSDGVHQHWFGPELMRHAEVSDKGIRVRMDGSNDRAIPLTARLFEFFSLERALQLKERWCELAQSSEANHPSEDHGLWRRISQAPPGAIHFQGTFVMDQENRAHGPLRQGFTEFAFAVSGFAVLRFLHETFASKLSWPVAFGVAALLGIRKAWLASRQSSVPSQSYQQGWITADELALRTNECGIRMPLSECVDRRVTDDLLVLTASNGRTYQLPRGHLVEKEQWQRLCRMMNDNQKETDQ